MAHEDIAQKLAKAREHALELSTLPRPPMSPEQEERERWQWESNAYAERTAMYSTARSVAGNHAIIPLEPQGDKPLVKASLATNNERRILEWWRMWPDANVGVPAGRANNLIALHVADTHAMRRLWNLAGVEQHNPDTDRRWTEYREFDAATLQWVGTKAVTHRSRVGWGRDFEKKTLEHFKESRPPEERWLLWSYPSIMSGADAHDFPSRRVGAGLQLLGPDEVVPWGGSVFDGDLMLQGPNSIPTQIPLWLAASIGKPRSRRKMDAAREAYEAAQRAMYGLSDAEVLKLAEAREHANAEAQAEVQRAKSALDRAEKADPPTDDDLPPVLEDDEPETSAWGGWLR